MSPVIHARGLSKRYGTTQALKNVDMDIPTGRIVGLIGPNGAGKTTALKSILGLTDFEGTLQVLGKDPRQDRATLMEQVCFIADVAVVPRWLRVQEALRFVEGVHPRFNRDRCERFLKTTAIKNQRVGALSKGMLTQLHLALIMAIDAKLLILDEPTIGLDILYRKTFYQRLLEDYFDQEKTILITTHQVEEVESLLTDVLFLNDGRLVLDSSMDALGERFTEVSVRPNRLAQARALNPLHERSAFGQTVMLYESGTREQLESLGSLQTPSLTDLFIATVTPGEHS